MNVSTKIKATLPEGQSEEGITRYRQSFVEEKAREINRLQGVLEGANIKLASVITDISDMTGMGILNAIVNVETNNEKLSTMAKESVVSKVDEYKRALKGNIRIHQQIMLSHYLRHIVFLNCRYSLNPTYVLSDLTLFLHVVGNETLVVWVNNRSIYLGRKVF